VRYNLDRFRFILRTKQENLINAVKQ
jgi:hypothetical protein